MGILSPPSGEKAALDVGGLIRSIRNAGKSGLDSDQVRPFRLEYSEVLPRPDTPPACRMTSTFGKPHSVEDQEVSRA